jgi:hypothetical protein
MKLTLYQILITLVAAYFIGERFTRFMRREKTQSLFKFLTIALLWFCIIAITDIPQFASWFSHVIGMGDKDGNSIILMGFVIVFLILLRMLSIIERIERNITDLVRRDALEDLKKSEPFQNLKK